MTNNLPAPANESARLAALERYAIIDTPAEEEFNHFIEVVALAFRVPWAAINLVDGFRAWRKAAFPADQRREAPRAVSFCGKAIETADVMVIPDAQADPCFAHFPNVTGGQHVRFYAGAPLITDDGYRIGTLCVLDSLPREFDAIHVELLRRFAREAMHKIDVRRRLGRTNDLSRQLGKVIKSSQIGVVTCDIDGRIATCNAIAESLTGWTEAEVVGQEFPFAPRGTERGFKRVLRALKRGETIVLERSRLRRRNGDLLRVRASFAPLFAADGTAVGFVCVAEDTDAIELAKQRAQVLEAAVLSAFSRAVIVTTAGPEDPRIVYANPAFTRLYGFDAVEIVGQKERTLWRECPDPDADAKIRAARRTNSPLLVEMQHRRQNGETFWCELGLTPVVDPDGQCRHWVAFATDVTNKHQSDQAEHERMAIVGMIAANAPTERILQALVVAGERAFPDGKAHNGARSTKSARADAS